MKTKSFLLLLISGASLFIYACGNNDTSAAVEKPVTHTEQLERGRYLVLVAGCNDCHSPKNMTPMGPVIDSSRMLSGHPEEARLPEFSLSHLTPGNGAYLSDDLTAAAGPWGVSFAYNLTPDSSTGIGAWTDESFIKILRSGKHMGAEAGRPILPPMPWQTFKQMPDADLKAIFAYLKSIPPVNNRVPEALTPDEVLALRKK